jgi:hypothetical protein
VTPQAILEGFFWNGVQLRHHILYDILAAVKMGTFQQCLQSREQPKIKRSHVRRIGSLANLQNAVLGQETLDQV